MPRKITPAAEVRHLFRTSTTAHLPKNPRKRGEPKPPPRGAVKPAAAAPRESRTPARKKQGKKSQRSKLEEEFDKRWKRLYPTLHLQREIRFCKTRKWRFDFGHLETRVAIEIEGGIWVNGGHTRGQGYEDDTEKYNTAQSSDYGWVVFRLTPRYAKDEEMLAMIARTIVCRREDDENDDGE